MSFPSDFQLTLLLLPVSNVSSPFTFLISFNSDVSEMVPFSGFFSKDEILTAVFDFNPNFGILMSFIAGLTAFYMFRLYYNIFWGTPSQYAHTPHEAPRSMTIPLMILAAIMPPVQDSAVVTVRSLAISRSATAISRVVSALVL